ncbi:MAG: electron transfer flavoprotein subunit beta/FixA family protein [Actinomycetota bacterium]
MNILICVKRVPATGGRITLTPDEQDIDTRFLGFTVSPHEECAVEEAVRLIEAHGGTSKVLTLGPPEAEEQLRDALAVGIERAILLDSGGHEWDPGATAAAIVEAVRASAEPFDLLLFGNESADSGNYQVGIRVAHALGLPVVTGVKHLELDDGEAVARREAAGGWEVYRVPLPSVVTVREGINLPRYPSVPGRLKAKKKELERREPKFEGNTLEMIRLKLPPGSDKQVDILGTGPDAAPKVVEVLKRIGVA